MSVYVIAGEPGTGKTSQIFTIANTFRPVRWASFESKDKTFFDKFIKNGEPNVPAFDASVVLKTYPEGHKDVWEMPDEYLKDPVATLGEFEKWVHDTLKEKPKTVVVDGISELREFATDEWIFLDNQEKIRNKMVPRKSIGKENIAARGDINKRVKRLIAPLIQYGFSNGVNVFFTATMKDKYTNNEVVGISIDARDWILKDSEVNMIFHKDTTSEGLHYWIECDKIPAWATTNESSFKTDIRKTEGLLEILLLYGLIKR